MRGGKRNQFRAIIRKANGGSGLCYSSLIKMIYNCTKKLFCFPSFIESQLTSTTAPHTTHGKLPNRFCARNIIKQVCAAFPASSLWLPEAFPGQSWRTLVNWGSRALAPCQQWWDLLNLGLHQDTSSLSLPSPDWGEGRLPPTASWRLAVEALLLTSGRRHPCLVAAVGKAPVQGKIEGLT